MRILDELNLGVVWSWGELEQKELATRFKANLATLLQSVKSWNENNDGEQRLDLDKLALELQEAGELLEECSSNCFALSSRVHTLGGANPEEQARRASHLKALERAIGKQVILTQTSRQELQGKTVILEQIRGTKGIVRNGSDFWETPLNRIMVVGG